MRLSLDGSTLHAANRVMTVPDAEPDQASTRRERCTALPCCAPLVAPRRRPVLQMACPSQSRAARHTSRRREQLPTKSPSSFALTQARPIHRPADRPTWRQATGQESLPPSRSRPTTAATRPSAKNSATGKPIPSGNVAATVAMYHAGFPVAVDVPASRPTETTYATAPTRGVVTDKPLSSTSQAYGPRGPPAPRTDRLGQSGEPPGLPRAASRALIR